MVRNGRIYLKLINAGRVKILVEKYPPCTYLTHYTQKDSETDEELLKRIMDHVNMLSDSEYKTGHTPYCLPIYEAKAACGIG